MRLDSTAKMEIRIGLSYTRYFMRSIWAGGQGHMYCATVNLPGVQQLMDYSQFLQLGCGAQYRVEEVCQWTPRDHWPHCSILCSRQTKMPKNSKECL